LQIFINNPFANCLRGYLISLRGCKKPLGISKKQLSTLHGITVFLGRKNLPNMTGTNKKKRKYWQEVIENEKMDFNFKILKIV